MNGEVTGWTETHRKELNPNTDDGSLVIQRHLVLLLIEGQVIGVEVVFPVAVHYFVVVAVEVGRLDEHRNPWI